MARNDILKFSKRWRTEERNLNFLDAIKSMNWRIKKQEYHQLYTKWGEELNPNEVLTEYPRPQLKRNNYFILNGRWDYKITDSKLSPKKYTGKVLVPFSPESVLSGVGEQLQPDEVLWYHRSIEIQEVYPNKKCILHFGAVDQWCKVYVNQEQVGEHLGGYLPFSIDITKQLKAGTNHIEVCVTDDSDTSYHSRGKQKLDRGGMFYTAQSGIWQTVWLEWVPNRYIEKLKIEPRYDSSEVLFKLTLNQKVNEVNEGIGEGLNNSITKGLDRRSITKREVASLLFTIEIYASNRLLVRQESKSQSLVVKLPKRIPWSPEHPFLYQVKLQMGEDSIESYFAMRKIEVAVGKDGIPRIHLNDEPYFQNGVLDQGYWPDGLYTAPSDEAMIYDIMTMKELGFQMIRKHIKIEPLRWYYHCDRLGMLVWQDMVNGGENYHSVYVSYLPTISTKAVRMKDHSYSKTSRGNKKGREEWLVECKETVDHLYNCPCIVVWVPFNEGWGQFDAKEVVTLIRTSDKTRLIDHASGWFDQGVGDLKSVHNYFRKLEVHLDHRAYVISEYGGYACHLKGHSYSDNIYGYRRYATTQQLTKAYHKLMKEEVHRLIEQGLSAAVYTQLSDVEDEVNGLLTYDRKVVKVN